MSVREVTELRKEGRLDEALELARRELDETPNEWTRMSLFWVLRDLATNRFVPANHMEQAQHCLEQMEELLPEMMDDKGVGERACQYLCKLILPHASEVRKAYDLSKSNPIEAFQTLTERLGMDAGQLDPKLHEYFGWIVYRYMKANADRLTSVEIRRLLRDYMQLQNKRPSVLHSMMLNYAINFSKGHSDFNFYRFFMLWGAENLRPEDYEEGSADGHTFPSLTSRICKAIVDSNEAFDVPAFVSLFDRENVITENLRQAYFWKLMNLQKENRLEQLFRDFAFYAEHFAAMGPSYWHSEILRIANRFMINENASRFVPFFLKWDGAGNLRPEDWMKETNEEGKEFPSLAVKSAKKCFEVLKAMPKDTVPDATLEWLKGMYEQVKDNDPKDDWNVRNYAMLCVWCGETEKAISLYKSLLLHMGEKYYLWAELANLIDDRGELCIGLLLKAKKTEKNEDFLGDIHLALASLWLKEGWGSLAQKELEAYASHRREKGWAVSERFRELQAKVVPGADTSAKVDFNSYIAKAEDYVYGDFDLMDFVITDKWTSENVERCNLYDGKGTNLRVKTKRFPVLKKAKAGDIVQIRCHVVEERQPDPSMRLHRMVTVKNIFPLIARRTDKEPWSLLPLKYGVVDYVNENRKTLHIITQDCQLVFSEYKWKPLPVNSFVKFRVYEDSRKGETRICVKKLEPCATGEALPQMPHCAAVVDGVNGAKSLFHVVLGRGIASDIVRFDQTDIRPAVGDVLHVSYCIKRNKEGKERVKFLDIRPSDEG